MIEQWRELKETIIEMRDNDGTGTQQEVCKFLANLMDVLEKQMSDSEKPNKGDLISRQAAIDALSKYVDYSDDGEQEINADSVFLTLEKLPSVEPIDVQESYYKGKIDGIRECTAKLKKVNEELANG